ncbi:histidine-rich protein PFHRP-II-like [Penaeus monodon]|uniref:histidine-rich protein PFHRP-II-like n=1 Tax=Penaeus monodon TaxID=6687 RepID=UPI0018A77450|nr:histidine-rich protein PFHRP-II-like [Penaeus monodon]
MYRAHVFIHSHYTNTVASHHMHHSSCTLKAHATSFSYNAQYTDPVFNTCTCTRTTVAYTAMSRAQVAPCHSRATFHHCTCHAHPVAYTAHAHTVAVHFMPHSCITVPHAKTIACTLHAHPHSCITCACRTNPCICPCHAPFGTLQLHAHAIQLLHMHKKLLHMHATQFMQCPCQQLLHSHTDTELYCINTDPSSFIFI